LHKNVVEGYFSNYPPSPEEYRLAIHREFCTQKRK